MQKYFTDILQLPDNCLVNKKLTKAFFKRNFDLISSEKNLLDDYECVKSMDWLASVSTLNANIPAYTDNECTFEEVEFILLETTPAQFDKAKTRLAELVQKYIPYHTVLFVYTNTNFIINTCNKRINQNDLNRRIIEKHFFTENISFENSSPTHAKFLGMLAFGNKDKTHLKAFYDSYIQQMVALQTANISGDFTLRPAGRTKQDVEHLELIKKLETDILQLQNLAKKETQMNKRVELNMTIQNKRQLINNLKKLITTA